MTLPLQATIFNSETLAIRGTFPVPEYFITVDALSNASSTITVLKQSNMAKGDYVAVREVNSTVMLYYGQITTVDPDDSTNYMKLTANRLWNVVNGDTIITAMNGSSYETHLIRLIRNYINSNLSTNVLNYSITNSTNTSYQVTNSDTLSVSNLIDYMIRGFKLHNTTFDITGIGSGTRNGQPFYFPKIDIHQITDTWNFRNDAYAFKDWEVTDTRALRGYANELWIVNKNTTNMESPGILARYWLQKDGSVTKTLNTNVVLPTQVKVYLYDTTATDKPSYDSVASDQLTGNVYSHSIKFSMPIENNFLPLDKVKVGLQSNIYYDGTLYKSILSAFSLNSSDELIELTFGNLRFGKNDLFGNKAAV